MPPAPLSWYVDARDGLVVVTVCGTVDAESSPALDHALAHWVRRDPVALLIDLSGASITDPAAAATVSRILQQAELWPGTPVGLCALDPSTTGMIMTGSAGSLLLFDSVADGRSALTGHAGRLSEPILPVRGAARRGRDITTEACLRWNLPHLIAPAVLVASELVTNAVVHTHTPITLQLRRRPRYLYLAVSDGSHTEPVPQRPAHPDTPHGRGLPMVHRISTQWGWQRHPDGKVVWAAFATPPTA